MMTQSFAETINHSDATKMMKLTGNGLGKIFKVLKDTSSVLQENQQADDVMELLSQE